jgi:AbrB family looped-hinge helix DNA binding protein
MIPKVIYVSRMTSNARVTLPKGLRKSLGLINGDQVELMMAGGRILVRRARAKSISKVRRHLR